jgi:transposase
MRPAGSPEVLESRRLRAVALLKQGLQPVEVATRLGVDRRSVRRWKAAHRRGGERAIRAKPAAGRPPKLTRPHRRQLEKILVRGAQDAGFPTDLWTCPRIACVIRERFAVDYHVDHVCRLLRAMGWSVQRPVRVASERNEQQIQQWLKRDWPSAKKKPAN